MLKESIDEVLNKYGVKFTKALKRQLKVDRTYATGSTYKSIKYSVKDSSLILEYDSTMNIIDAGRKAGRRMPSSTDILIWMKARNVRPRDRFGRFLANTTQNRKRAAFAITRGIGRRGTIKRFGYKGSKILDFVNKNSDLRLSFERDLKIAIEDDLSDLF
tara:strand:- start:7382 stop:7861 length:480 start_codon:yes stop_codon:yes gene_type:complete